MQIDEQQGKDLAIRAMAGAAFTAEDTQAFGTWLLDVMSRVIMVQSDNAVDMRLRRLARTAFYDSSLPAEDLRSLAYWVRNDLDTLRQRDRRGTGSAPRTGGRRMSDREGYTPVRAAHKQEVDDYFGITQRLTAEGCEHGVAPAKACTHADCAGRRAHLAWDGLV